MLHVYSTQAAGFSTDIHVGLTKHQDSLKCYSFVAGKTLNYAASNSTSFYLHHIVRDKIYKATFVKYTLAYFPPEIVNPFS